MKAAFGKSTMLVVLLGLSSATFARAEETPAAPASGSKGTAIIFSAPKSDVVSSNLNEVRAPASPFRDMESSLKKPFQSLNSGRETFRPAKITAPSAEPQVRRKSLKEQMNERAEQMFLEPELYKGESDAELFGLREESYDPYEKKNKSSLDRYYDRVDRAAANRAEKAEANRESGLFESIAPRSSNPFADYRESFQIRNTASSGMPLSQSGNNLSPAAGDTSTRSYFRQPDRLTTFRSGDAYSGFRQTPDARVGSFKRLLEGSGSGNSSLSVSSSVTVNSSPYQITPSSSFATPAPVVNRSVTVTPAPSTPSFTDSARLVGNPYEPQGVPNYAPAVQQPSRQLNLSTPTSKPLPPPTFKLPQRRH